MRWLLAALLLLPLSALADNPRVELNTTLGRIVLELEADKAPVTVANFLGYVDSGFYDGTLFHRVIRDFMVQGGGFAEDHKVKSTGDPIRNEADNGLSNRRGTIAMARTRDPHSASAQFFINTVDNTALDHSARTDAGWGYAVFGRVVEGMDVVDSIGNTRTGQRSLNGYPVPDVPLMPILIESARRLSAAQPVNKP